MFLGGAALTSVPVAFFPLPTAPAIAPVPQRFATLPFDLRVVVMPPDK